MYTFHRFFPSYQFSWCEKVNDNMIEKRLKRINCFYIKQKTQSETNPVVIFTLDSFI